MSTRMNTLVVVSPYHPIDCEHRLIAGFAARSSDGPAATRLHGKIRDSHVVIWFTISGVRNSFVPVFDGRIEPHESGARISGRFRLHRSVAVFMACWVIAVCITMFAGLASLIARMFEAQPFGIQRSAENIPAGTWAAIGIPVVMLIIGGLIMAFGRSAAQSSEQSTIHFLCASIDGEPARATSRGSFRATAQPD